MQTISRLAGLALLSLYISCFSSETVKCGDNGPTCPVGWTCIAELSACINPLETLCGNGVVDEGEECDDGNFDNRDECNWDCRPPRCGDGFIRSDLGEVCDDANTGSGDGCSSDCKSREICGDNIINTVTGEACDSGSFCDDLTTACTSDEQCEGIGEGTCGPRNINCCTADCRNPYCGNGVTERDCAEIHTDRIMEVCDFGSQCANGQPCIVIGDCAGIGDGRCLPRDNPNCSQTCLFANPCGDGITNTAIGEVCDGGRFCADLTDCVSDADCAGKAGDELCLPRNTARCTADCRSEGVCGDGITNDVPPYDEVCDDGKHCSNGVPCTSNAECPDNECIPRGDDGCSADCKATGRCGDGEVDQGEACDDGNRVDGDGCSADCRNRCGDGVLHASEECDDGEECTDGVCNGPTRACLTECVRARCGDSLVQAGVEDCDSGAIDSADCNQDCTEALCADGYRNVAAGEECDSSGLNTIDCNENCTYPRCGDSIVNRAVGERCDDGNRDNLDGCSADCTSNEECGDGVTNFAVGELCDNAKTCDSGGPCESDTDCPTDELCLPRSGDGCSQDCRSTEICGDGYVNLDLEVPETCDDFNLDAGDGCSPTCQIERGWACEPRGEGPTTTSRCDVVCGDGVVVLGFELCDDGDTQSGDGCSSLCQAEVGWACPTADGIGGNCAPVCGDGLVRGGEPCDDGNRVNDDGCSATCTVEAGYACPPALNGRCQPVCGDGLVRAPETCDDNDTTSLDGCSATCQTELGWTCDTPGEDCTPVCGDGLVRGGEPCDDGNLTGGDGCSSTCGVEAGWECPANLNGRCRSICGDGLIRGTEGCDDANVRANDGCSATCQPEAGWSCPVAGGNGGACTADCGDGLVRGTEQCDDANILAGDGCSATCQRESGWACPQAGGVPIGGSCREVCGDSQVVGAETCDDTNAVGGDGCDSGCRTEDGWTCPATGGFCTPICGDGRVVGAETCDEGTATASGGCTNCVRTNGWSCVAGQSCTSICGDSITVGVEECDNGASNSNNGPCTVDCKNATCTDGLRLSQGADAETDVDCGGVNDCPRCANDFACVAHSDCLSNFCSTNSRCQTPILTADVWTFHERTLQGGDISVGTRTLLVADLLANDAGGNLASDAIFELVADTGNGVGNPSCGSVAYDDVDGILTFTNDDCTWAETFQYRVVSPLGGDPSAPVTVTVNVNKNPTLVFPNLCLPLTSSSATVSGVFNDVLGNAFGAFDPAPYVTVVPSGEENATIVGDGTGQLTLTPQPVPAPGIYKANVVACDDVVGTLNNVPLTDDDDDHRGCSAVTEWSVSWQASAVLREFDDSEAFPVLLDAALTFPQEGTAANSVVDGAATSPVFSVAAFPTGPFATTITTALGNSCQVDGSNIVYTADNVGDTAGPDSCFVRVCETCQDLQLCNVMRLPIRNVDPPVAVADTVDGLEGFSPASGTFPRSALVANDLRFDIASFDFEDGTIEAGPLADGASTDTDCEGTVTYDVDTDTFTYVGPDPTVPLACLDDGRFLEDTFTYRICAPEFVAPWATSTWTDTPLPAACKTAIVTIDINQHPEANADARTTDEDTPLVLTAANLLANDCDWEENEACDAPPTTLRIVDADDPSNGTLIVDYGPTGAVESVSFIPDEDLNSDNTIGTFSFDYHIADDAAAPNTGTATTTVTITVDAVNDAPLNDGSLPDSVTVTEDGASPSTVDLSLLDLFDVDSDDANPGPGNLTVTLTTSTGGELSAVDGGGVDVDGTATARTLTGTLSALNAFFDIASNITYLHPTAHLNGTAADSIAVQVSDLGNTGSGGVLVTPLGTVRVDITAVNDDPAQTGLPSDVTVTEDVLSNLDISAMALTDVDAGSGSLTLTLTTTGGAFTSANAGGVTVTGSGTATLTLAGTLLALNTFIDNPASIRYLHGTPDTQGDNAATFSVSITDNGSTGNGGGGSVALGTVNIDITAVNDAPTVSIPTNPYSADEQVNLNLHDTAIAVADVDSATSDVTATFSVTFGTLTVTVGTSGAVIDSGNGTGTVVVTGTIAEIQALLTTSTGTLIYNANSDNPPASATFTVSINDGGLTGSGGSLVGQASAQIDITALNDAPTGAPKTVTIAEDTTYTFATTDFGFSDVDLGDSLSAVRIDDAPDTGTLMNGTDVVGDNTLIAVADIIAGDLHFVPASNGNGSPYTTFTFSVRDTGVPPSGQAFDGTPRTMTINVTAVNDAPTVSIPTNPYSADEQVNLNLHDTAIAVADVDSASSDVTATFSVTFGTLTVAIGDSGATIVSGNGTGTVVVSGTIAELQALLTTGTGTLIYNANSDNPPASATFAVSINDGGNTGSGGSLVGQASAQIDITALNDAPTGAPKTVTIAEDTTYTFATTDFGFSDVDLGDSLSAVRIDDAPDTGTLMNGTDVVGDNTLIAVADIIAGDLHFVPASNGNGSPYTTFTFSVRDTGVPPSGQAFDGTPRTMTINVTAVNDAPTVSIPTNPYSADEQVNLNLHDTAIAVADVDSAGSDVTATFSVTFGILTVVVGDSGVEIDSGDGTGTVVLSGTITEIQDLLTDSTGTLVYNANSDNPPASATFTLSINDGGFAGSGGTLVGQASAQINITAINDAPTGANKTVTIAEDTTYTFATTDFGFADVDLGDALSAVRIDTLETAGSLTNSGVDVVDDAVIPVADIVAGNLKFTPANHANGTAYANFTFSVRDVGVPSSGQAFDAAPNTMTIDVTAVNDAPTVGIPTNPYSADEQVNLNLHDTAIAVADVDSAGSDVTATFSVTFGILTVVVGDSGVEIDSGDGTGTVVLSGTITEIQDLLTDSTGTLVYNANSDNPPASATLTIEIDDGGFTGSGGALVGQATSVIVIQQVNDAPTATIAIDPYSALDNTSLALHGTGIAVTDADSGTSDVTVTLSVADSLATLTVVEGTTGVSVLDSPSSEVTLIGTISEISALLAGTMDGTIHYNNDIASDTIDALNLFISDGGATGTGGTLTDEDIAIINVDFAETLTYDGTTFNEASANDGSIANSLEITLAGDTFTVASGTLTAGTHYTVANVPTGLTASVTISGSGTIATFALTGNATSHTDANDVSNLTLNFLDAAFTNADAANVTNASRSDLVIDFIDL